MNVNEIVTTAKDALTVKRVFGEPYDKDGVTVIPAAAVSGGLGGGSGHDEKGQVGEGGGFGVAARPVGAYVLRGGEVHWRPAWDATRTVTVAGAVLAVYLLMRPRMARARGR